VNYEKTKRGPFYETPCRVDPTVKNISQSNSDRETCLTEGIGRIKPALTARMTCSSDHPQYGCIPRDNSSQTTTP